ncbi:MAG: preprotein translocase subunit SecY [Bacilli bacterium]|jgi:preprotein translocase subunit SecY|nr:preprotein translocase subunit SecY [Bacilli bacterium]
MFALVKQIMNPKNKDIKQRVLFTLGVLFIFELGTVIPIPGTENIVKDLGFLELFNAMGGGALKNFSIFALGVFPYISASIIMQLLQMDVIPYFTELGKQGHVGKQKLNKITRYFGITIAFLQGYVFSIAFLPQNLLAIEYMRVAVILTAGTALLLWLGDQITQKGIGNGLSLIIMAGILSTIPMMFVNAYQEIVDFTSTQTTFISLIGFLIFVLVYLIIVIGIIYIQQAERRIPIQYANRTTTAYGAKQTYMPVKLNSAGVIPVIFASMAIAVPATIAQFVNNEKMTLFIEKYISYDTITGFAFYVLLIVFFAYFYTFLQLKPDKLANDLQQSGGYIPGIRPGGETTKYISQILSRLTLVGAVFLIVIAGLPIIFSNVSNLSSNITIGGTGLLIVVGVLLETYNQLEGKLLTRNYKVR